MLSTFVYQVADSYGASVSALLFQALILVLLNRSNNPFIADQIEVSHLFIFLLIKIIMLVSHYAMATVLSLETLWPPIPLGMKACMSKPTHPLVFPCQFKEYLFWVFKLTWLASTSLKRASAGTQEERQQQVKDNA